MSHLRKALSAGGILVWGNLHGSPKTNTAILAIGTLLASVMGTTGAAMLMIRPLLKANDNRKHRVHAVIFFIFLVANIGGGLTPLGDPPLFLGFLRGVPFTWTFNLLREYLFVNVMLLVSYYALDSYYYSQEPAKAVHDDDTEIEPLGLKGSLNFVFFAVIIAAVAFALIRDTPASVGLPPIEEYRDDPAKVASDTSELERMSYWRIVIEHVFKNRAMLLLAFANVFVYALRYGVLSWAPTYLSQVHRVSVAKGIAGFSLFELAGLVGTLACGWASDRIFKGNRTRTGVTFLIGVGVFLVLYWLAPVGTPYWLLMVHLFFIGAFIYGPVMLIGLQAIDMSAAHVAGTSAGFTGLFGYVLGATMASTGVGYVAEHFGWYVTYGMLVAFVVVAVILLALIGPEERRLIEAHRVRSGRQ